MHGVVDELAGDRGFAVTGRLAPEAVAGLLELFASIHVASSPAMHRTFADESRETARAIDAGIKALVADALGALLPDHQQVLATFISKGPGGDRLDFHQDWTFCDEREHRTVQTWIPLVDADAGNGSLALAPGTHRWTDGIRTSTTPDVRPGPTDDFQSDFEAMADTPSLAAGSLLMYDAAIVHGSGPNLSDQARPAVVIASIPKAAQPLHFCETIERYCGFAVDAAYFTDQPFESVPVGYPEVEPWTAPVQPADFARRLGPAA
ncbi:MAG: phytanoyl-CoA dioxygenase family protein [Acidimicrobiales bacterium]